MIIDHVEFKDIVIFLEQHLLGHQYLQMNLWNMDIPTYADTGIGYFDTIEIKTIMSLTSSYR